jgi:hypothetical protein
MSHILEYLKYKEQDNKYNYMRYYKVLPKLLQGPNTGIASEIVQFNNKQGSMKNSYNISR